MSSAKPPVKRTYSSRIKKQETKGEDTQPSKPSVLASQVSPPFLAKRKLPFSDAMSNVNLIMSTKKTLQSKSNGLKPKKAATTGKKAPNLTQLHFNVEQSVLRTCPLCDLSYMRGAVDDENLHKSHCARVRRGMEWGKEDERERSWSDGQFVVEEDVMLKSGERGRIVAIKKHQSDKLWNKVSAYLKTVNLALSSPDLTNETLEASKTYLFLLRTAGCTREKIVGCVVAQQISTAMEVATEDEVTTLKSTDQPLVHVEGNMYCKPESLSTPMGIPRLFVSSAHRRKGIAEALLTAAARTFVHGCELEPSTGEVAFSQPTSMGRKVMEKWGKGGVRIYEE